jgi:hypothetical protein
MCTRTDVQDSRIGPPPVQHHPREGWAEAAKALAEAGEGEVEWPDHEFASDADWVW